MILNPPILVVVDDKKFGRLERTYILRRKQPWYLRFANRSAFFTRRFRLANEAGGVSLVPAIVIRRSHEHNEKLLAHEYGHFMGLKHPSALSLDFWSDIMSPLPLRFRDRWGVRAACQKWLGPSESNMNVGHECPTEVGHECPTPHATSDPLAKISEESADLGRDI